MYGYRWCTETEQLRLFERLEAAIEHRHPLTVSYFKQRRDTQGDLMTFEDGTPLFVKTTRVIEPYELAQTLAGHLIVKVMDRSPNDSERPASRTIRLDRIAYSKAKGRPIMQAHPRGRYMCPSPLDETDSGGSAPMALPLPAAV